MKTVYVAACCLLALAVALDLAGKRSYSMVARCRARCMNVDDSQRASIKAESRAMLAAGNRQALSGMIAAGLGVASWITSALTKRRMADG